VTRPLLAGVAALALAGCTFVDTREVWVEPAGPYHAARALLFTPRGRGVEQVEIRVDGHSRGVYPVDVPATVLVDVDGDHALEIEAANPAPGPVHRVRATTGVLAAVRLEPPPGPVPSGEPLSVEVELNAPIEALDLSATGVAVGFPSQSVSVAVTGPRTLRLQMATRLDAIGAVSLQLRAVEHGGQTVFLPLGTWGVPIVTPDVTAAIRLAGTTAATAWTGEGVAFEVSATGTLPASLELWAGSLLVATLTGAGPWTVPWDVTAVPDGTYAPVTLVAGGSQATLTTPGVSVVVDHVAPTVVACQGRPASTALELTPTSCLDFETSEPVSGAALLLVGGAVVAEATPSVATSVLLCPAVPMETGAAVLLDLSALRDRAGHPVSGSGCGTITVPAYPSPLGPGPLSVDGAELQALDAAVGFFQGGASLEMPSVAVAYRPVGAPGTWRQASGPVAGPVQSELVGPIAAGGATTGVDFDPGARGATWIEVDGAGQETLREASRNFAAWATSAPLQLGAGAAGPSMAAGCVVAWTEPNAAGGSVVRVAIPPYATVPWYDWATFGDPAATSTAEALTTACGPPGPWLTPVIAWIEAGSGGGGPLHVQAFEPSAWVDLRAPDETAALGTGAEVAVARLDGSTVAAAWVDGGSLWLSVAGSSGVWSPAVSLGADPSATAARPRFAPPVTGAPTLLAWVERGASGDRIRLRDLAGGAWTLRDVPVNDGVPGTVSSLRVAERHLSWIDDAGRVYVRELHR
jgi:hypothetical protein